MGNQVFDMIKEFFNNVILESGINNTNICLILKKQKTKIFTEYMPINLCNVVYKIVAKVLAKRLKKVMPSIISSTQAIFVEGRIISDNILVAHELQHVMKSKSKCDEEFIAIKTDISKAYDRVEWNFLEDAMKILSFSEKWRSLIMECVKSIRYQVLINGKSHGKIIPTRGLRQSDPMSPYLFVMCTEILVQMLQQAEKEKKLTGLKVARSAPPITHILFADDSIFYCKERDEEISQVVRIIEEYNLASGQRVNYQKSSINFGKRIPEQRRAVIKRKLGIDQECGKSVYLGLPEEFSGSKVAILNYLKDRLNQKVLGWQTKFLSSGGKETLLKAVAIALPSYTMACFRLPKTFFEAMSSIMADFWWRNKKESKEIHWKVWQHMCKPKKEGGLGFKDIESFNTALLGKQLWRMITHPNSLLGRVYKARYFSKSDLLDAKLRSRSSFAWKSIHSAQQLIKAGTRRVVGNGEEVRVWQDQWISSKPARAINTMNLVQTLSYPFYDHELRVKYLLRMDRRDWNRDILQNLFPAGKCRLIEELRPGGPNSKDGFVWDFTKSGNYSVKSGY